MIPKIFVILMFALFIFGINIYEKPSYELIYEKNNNYVYKISEPFQKEEICLTFSLKNAKQDFMKQGCVFAKNSKLLVYDYAKVMLSSLYFNPKPSKILILGRGLGTLTQTFAELLPNSHIDVVDINSNLLELDKKYFDFDIEKYKNVSLHLIDAFEYIKDANAKGIKYDIIIGDAFDEQYIPKQFLTNEYMQMIKNIMSDNGIFSNNSFPKSKARELEDKLMVDNFGKKYLIYQKSEKITFTTKDNEKLPLKILIKDDENYIRFKDIFKKYGINDDSVLKNLRFNQNH